MRIPPTIPDPMLTARAAHRYCNIADMTPEQRGNRIAIFGVVLEYCVHGEWLMSETDENGRWGAWWVPLRKMVKDCGKEAVEEKLDAFEADVAEEKATAMAAAMADAGIVWFIPGLSQDVLGFCLSRDIPGYP